MDSKIKFEDKQYDLDDLSDSTKKMLFNLQFTNNKLQELTNMQALLQRAKNSYLDSLRKEIISNKAGFTVGEDS